MTEMTEMRDTGLMDDELGCANMGCKNKETYGSVTVTAARR